VGKDIRFELSLIKRYGVQVFAFDPSPVAVEWIKAQVLPPEFHFVALGAATFDGKADFHCPSDVTDPNWSTVVDASAAVASAQCDVMRVASIGRMLGHNRIDILKMDIEGAEYGVIEDWLEAGPEAHQFLVEFHHRMASLGSQKTRDAVRLLNSKGYKIFHISMIRPEFGFIKA
jgi:FkbM family methyltransferase